MSSVTEVRRLVWIGLLGIALAACSNSEERLRRLRETVPGCYATPGFPMVEIRDDEIRFGSATLTRDFTYQSAGRSADGLISIKPRLYLYETPRGFSYREVPWLAERGDYSAQWAIIPAGEEGERIRLVALYTHNLTLERIDCFRPSF